MDAADGFNSAELTAVKSSLENADNLGNNENIELGWAMKAMDHAIVHFNLISSIDAKELKLTKLDDNIFETFREHFPDLDVSLINEDELKSPASKEQWRNFCELFKERVEDYNMGTLLRLDCTKDYTPENSTFSVRTQFLAIEITRNREGLNTPLSIKKKEAQEKDS